MVATLEALMEVSGKSWGSLLPVVTMVMVVFLWQWEWYVYVHVPWEFTCSSVLWYLAGVLSGLCLDYVRFQSLQWGDLVLEVLNALWYLLLSLTVLPYLLTFFLESWINSTWAPSCPSDGIYIYIFVSSCNSYQNVGFCLRYWCSLLTECDKANLTVWMFTHKQLESTLQGHLYEITRSMRSGVAFVRLRFWYFLLDIEVPDYPSM